MRTLKITKKGKEFTFECYKNGKLVKVVKTSLMIDVMALVNQWSN